VYNLSIIIPIFNEQLRLKSCLTILKKFVEKKSKKKIEIIFVNDGSTDKSGELINEFINKNKKVCRLKYINYKKNVGKGYAIKKGVLNSNNSWILICDADMSVKPYQFEVWFKKNKIINKNTAYYGSRSHKNSRIKTLFIRRLLGIFFKILIKTIFKIDLKDTQCGFKVFNKNYAHKIFKKLNSNRFAFDIELTLLLKKNKISIKELPLKWEHKDGSKLNIFVDMPKMFFDILIIKLKNKTN
jgi:dolichyl-phosphate beta-glucosyltransferase